MKDRLIQLRKDKKKTQEDIAKIIGITRPAYTAYERGSRNPDYETLKKLANYYDVTTDYLLGRSDNPKMSEEDSEIDKLLNDPQTDLMFKDWKNMNEEQREEAINMIKYILHKDKMGD